MYYVRIFDGPNDKNGMLIHSPRGIRTRFDIDLVLEGISSMSITISQNNPAFNRIRSFKTLIEVTHAKTHKKIFKGRFLKPEHSMNDSGLLTLNYSCEDRKAYLHDSNQRWAKVQNTSIRDFLVLLINRHNQQMEDEPHKQFKVGKVTVTNPTDNVYRYVGYGTTYEEIKDNLLDRLGGYLLLRDEPDGMYLDYLEEVGEKSTTEVTIRSNLKNFKRTIDPTKVITRVIPLGARLETDDSDYNASEPRLTIESVNNGVDYLEDVGLREEFGIKEGTITLDDVNTPSTLMLRGKQFFEEQDAALSSYDITAVNLNLLDPSIAEFEVGYWYDISVLPLANIEDTLQIIQMKLSSDNPQSDQLTFGTKPITLRQYQINMNRQTRIVDNLQNQVESSNRRVSQLRNAYTSVSYQVEEIQTDLATVDIRSLPVELQGIHNQISDLQMALQGRSNPLRVATFNIWGSRIDIEAYKNFALSNRLDIIGLQEVLETTPEQLKTYGLNNIKYEGSWYNYGNAIQSRFNLAELEVFELPGESTGRRILIKTTVEFEGKTISVYNTHLNSQEDDTVRLQQLEFIKQTMNADTTKYKILTGDFNVQDKAHYNLLGNLKSAQGHNGVWHDTWDVNIEPWNNGAIDNILVTPNIDILKVEMPLDKLGSDHYMLWAEIALR